MEIDLFREAFISLSFRRQLPEVYRNLILALVGLVIFLIGFFLGKIESVYIVGAIVMGGFLLWALVEIIILLVAAIRANRGGQILYATAVKAEPLRWRNRRYRLAVEVELPDGRLERETAQGPLWEADARVLMNHRFRVIYLGSKRAAILIPEYKESVRS